MFGDIYYLLKQHIIYFGYEYAINHNTCIVKHNYIQHSDFAYENHYTDYSIDAIEYFS